MERAEALYLRMLAWREGAEQVEAGCEGNPMDPGDRDHPAWWWIANLGIDSWSILFGRRSFQETSCFPRVLGGFVERRMHGKYGEGTPRTLVRFTPPLLKGRRESLLFYHSGFHFSQPCAMRDVGEKRSGRESISGAAFGIDPGPVFAGRVGEKESVHGNGGKACSLD